MKNKILFSIVGVLMSLNVMGASQEKKPTLMILPSDHWCQTRFFMTTWNNQGVKVKTADYQKAFLQDRELNQVISKIGQLLTKEGYSLKDAEQETKAVFNRIGEDNVTMSTTSGSTIAESPLDMIKKHAKMDILIQIDWTINSDRSVTFTLEAFDSYTSKRIATSTGTGKASDDIIPVLLEKAVKSKIKDFDKQMDNYFRDLKKHGREIVLTVRCWDSWDKDLEEEYNGEELTDCIQQWLREHTVDGVFNLIDGTETFLQFEQVRIPFYDEKNNAMDARAFATQLRKHLAKEPYNITAKVIVRGLGEALLVLGEK